MRADISTCQQIQCGAVTQDQAGADLLLACAEAGYVGARSCTDLLCAPYIAGMRRNGECPAQEASSSALAPPFYQSLPKATSQTMPSIVSDARAHSVETVPDNGVFSPTTILHPMPQIVAPPAGEEMPQVCGTFASWVGTNPLMAGLGLVALYFALRGMGGKK